MLDEIHIDHTPLTFGKYKGKTAEEVSIKDPAYIVWMFKNVSGKNTCSEALYRDCLQEIEELQDQEFENIYKP